MRMLGIILSAFAMLCAFQGLGLTVRNGRPVAGADAANVVPLTMRTPRSGFNRMVVSVTLCVPKASRCATIDDVMVDTGSVGLRLEASAVPAWLDLPAFLGPERKPLAECLHFVHDDAWGPLYRATLRMGGMTIADLPIQIIADDGGPQPAACPTSSVKPTSNGTLGLGPHAFDCPDPCRQSTSRPGVFVRQGGAWVPVEGEVARGFRLPNPATLFPGHGHGVALALPAVPPGGADEVSGTLTFGIGPGDIHRQGATSIVRLDRTGRFTTRYGGLAYPDSYIDSGTETYVFADAGLPRCDGMTWAFCATPERQRQAQMVGTDGVSSSVRFKVGDFRSLRERNVGASDSAALVADASSTAFVWGAPFFVGKTVYVVVEGEIVPGTDGLRGPLYAFREAGAL